MSGQAYRDRQRPAGEYARGYLAGWRECWRSRGRMTSGKSARCSPARRKRHRRTDRTMKAAEIFDECHDMAQGRIRFGGCAGSRDALLGLPVAPRPRAPANTSLISSASAVTRCGVRNGKGGSSSSMSVSYVARNTGARSGWWAWRKGRSIIGTER